jgi:hypothetical protein
MLYIACNLDLRMLGAVGSEQSSKGLFNFLFQPAVSAVTQARAAIDCLVQSKPGGRRIVFNHLLSQTPRTLLVLLNTLKTASVIAGEAIAMAIATRTSNIAYSATS